MKQWLQDRMDRFDLLSLRERALVIVAALGVVLLLWDSLLMSPLQRTRKVRVQQVQALRAEVAGLETSVVTVEKQAAHDPDVDARRQAQALRDEIAGLDSRLSGVASGLIDPREMSRVLEQVLQRTAALKLKRLRTLPPEVVTAPTAGAATPAGTAAPVVGPPAAGSTQVFRHGMEIELTGTYLETLQFLQALEALPWHFFWDRVEFTVDQHPQGHARVLIYTLGLQEGWLGV